MERICHRVATGEAIPMLEWLRIMEQEYRVARDETPSPVLACEYNIYASNFATIRAALVVHERELERNGA